MSSLYHVWWWILQILTMCNNLEYACTCISQSQASITKHRVSTNQTMPCITKPNHTLPLLKLFPNTKLAVSNWNHTSPNWNHTLPNQTMCIINSEPHISKPKLTYQFFLPFHLLVLVNLAIFPTFLASSLWSVNEQDVYANSFHRRELVFWHPSVMTASLTHKWLCFPDYLWPKGCPHFCNSSASKCHLRATDNPPISSNHQICRASGKLSGLLSTILH